MMDDIEKDDIATRDYTLLLNDSQLVSSFGSYGSVNSDHFEVIKPGVTPSLNHYEGNETLKGKIKKFFFW